MKNQEGIECLVNKYFDEPEKTVEQIFGEYAEELSEEDRVVFFDNLRKIIY